MTSIFLTALGDEAAVLRPEVARYAAGTGGGDVIGEGIFEVAGSRLGRLGMLLRPIVGPRLLLTARGRDVPFRVVNRPRAGEIHAERTLDFASGPQTFADVLRPGAPGTLVNLLGDARRIELRLRCSATGEGHLRLVSDRCWLRLGRLRLRLPGPIGVRVDVEDGFDDATGRQTVRARAWNPILGTVIEYRGSFLWRVEPFREKAESPR
ncbi:DUF4166 domain-containing protein [Microbacterium karelineae]|uniref:DUF4166 domain-containing protein n=1 Tax=Microbacterium karelineae TaxID=2654283 RepID=UPI0018D3A511|nr:DUF4166 domain-containing protein [Microbacterium karelineae]